MNADNIQSLARAQWGGMLCNFVSWAPPSVLICWTETYLVIFLHLSLLGYEQSFHLCCATGAVEPSMGESLEERGKEGASGHC